MNSFPMLHVLILLIKIILKILVISAIPQFPPRGRNSAILTGVGWLSWARRYGFLLSGLNMHFMPQSHPAKPGARDHVTCPLP